MSPDIFTFTANDDGSSATNMTHGSLIPVFTCGPEPDNCTDSDPDWAETKP